MLESLTIAAFVVLGALLGCHATFLLLSILTIAAVMYGLSLPTEEGAVVISFVFWLMSGMFFIPAWIAFLVTTKGFSFDFLTYFFR